MKICRVLGPVVSTVKHPSYEGHKLLFVRELDDALEDTGYEFIVLDRIQAGEGDVVRVMQEGNGVRQLLGETKLPVRSIVAGIVDDVALASGAHDER